MEIDSFLNIVRDRYSCRKYSNKKITKEAINNCIEAARLAPSACNKQPWRFVIVDDASLIKKICKKGLLPGIPMHWIEEAPILAVLCAEKSLITHALAPLVSKVSYHYVDLGIAGEHFVLAAKAQGLDTCWIGWFKEKSIKNILNIPKKIKVVSLLTLGYSDEKEKEQPEKKSLNEICSFNSWNFQGN